MHLIILVHTLSLAPFSPETLNTLSLDSLDTTFLDTPPDTPSIMFDSQGDLVITFLIIEIPAAHLPSVLLLVITTGLSKHLSLGGWRVGAAIVPRSMSGLFVALGQIASETWSCAPSPIQKVCFSVE